MAKATNVLAASAVPRFFEVPDSVDLRGAAPPENRQIAVRTCARSLAGMQKEAVAVSQRTGRAWRLTSDEGPYLDGHDEAPFPLAFVTAGFAASYHHEVARAAQREGLGLDELSVTVDNRYTMEGSALRGTMTGGALAPEVDVAATGADERTLLRLLGSAIGASPMRALLADEHTSRFTLTVDGAPRSLGRVAALDRPAEPDPDDLFARLAGADAAGAEPLMRRIAAAEERDDVDGGKGSSLRAEQRRTLHVRGVTTGRADGRTSVDVALHQPIGSTFRFLSTERVDDQVTPAPDAMTLVSAGIAFCFLTQLGRYAAITRQPLEHYRMVQDSRFPAAAPIGRAGSMDLATDGRGRGVVETDVFLDGDADLARTLVDMGEQTCFLHALCRTPLEPVVAGR